MKIESKIKEFYQYASALSMLEGKDQSAPVRNERGEVMPTPPNKLIPYNFKGERVRLNIMRIAKLVKARIEDYDERRKSMIKELSGESGEIKAGSPEHKAFLEKWDELMEEQDSIEIDEKWQIKYLFLRAEQNGIPASVLVALSPFIQMPSDEELDQLEKSEK